MINAPTLRQMQYLLALCKTKNFGRAAKACFVSQPTLSQAVVEMETILGAKLLDRSQRKKVAFTALGLDILSSATRILNEAETMVEKARAANEPLSGIIRLGVIPTIAPYLLPDILSSLQKQFPKFDFQLNENTSANLIAALEENEIDIALMALPYETRDLKQTTLFEEDFICASPKGTFTQNQILTVKDLDTHNLLLLQDGHCLRDHILSACKKSDDAKEQPFKATSLATLIQMVGQKFGITLLPAMVAKNGALPQTIDLHSFAAPAPSRQIGLVWNDRSYKKPNIEAIIKHLKKSL